MADGDALAAVPFSPWRAAPLVLLGKAELARLGEDDEALRGQLLHADARVIIVAEGIEPPQWLLAAVNPAASPAANPANAEGVQAAAGIALWQSPTSVPRLQRQLAPLLLSAFAPRCQLHAILLRVGGIGTLLLGDAGVGKSSLALSLLGRGHRLVADDRVSLMRSGDGLSGRNPAQVSGYLFVRGLGVVDVAREFGAMALAFDSPVEQVFSLQGADAAGTASTTGSGDADGVSAQLGLSGEQFSQSWLGVSLQGLILRGNSGAADRVEAYTRRSLLAKRGHRVADEFRVLQRGQLGQPAGPMQTGTNSGSDE